MTPTSSIACGRPIAATLLALALACPAWAQHGPSVQVGNVVPGISAMSVKLQSMRDLRFANMVRQQQDYTCGAAALATILQQMYGRTTSEREIIDDMLANTDPKLARERGFSLLDMKHYLERVGLRGRGYKVDSNTLQTIKIPVIALQNTRGYAHFVVVKRIHAGIAYVADPVLGHRQMPLEEFIADWNGIVFAVLGPGRKEDNALVASSRPLAAAQRADIVTRGLPPQQEFGLFGVDTF